LYPYQKVFSEIKKSGKSGCTKKVPKFGSATEVKKRS
jgi:hypothetical protein